ncbi:hypothetical protein BDM02DRAFT_3155531 [Thelephora ganbajun]|uniref:Uncharacterized protein n=1 Tax=Thelephora ganbajun TaxID=370292 RepID=A0ACB6ZH53_THEGA|nr:hypothetical protein BDM02DRAFT_3155531 [Thelephora ganbajun]
MDTFEEQENPFDTDDNKNPSSQASSSTKLNISEPSSPPQTDHYSLPAPSYGAFPQQQKADHWLQSSDDVEILIVDAQKTSVGSNSPYITYVIRAGNHEARHRYSEFESLRTHLVKLYPTLIIPPIPSKNTIGDYAVKQSKAKEDAVLIARRKRMLQTFLNRIARHPILSNERVFHRFLDGEVSWTEVLNSPPITLLPKNILKAPSHNPTDQEASPAYQALPNPSPTHPLRNPDQRFLDSEVFTSRFAAHISGPMEKVSRRTMKRWSDLAQDYQELGAALNGFSLNEQVLNEQQGHLSAALEKTGQANDATCASTIKLAQDLEQNWVEPIHEYGQFASIIKKLLVYRHQKHVQYEMTQDALVAKREQLEELEKSEREARRLEEALGRGRVHRSSSLPGRAASEEGRNEDEQGEEQDHPTQQSLPSLPPHPGPSTVRRRAPGMGFLSALSYTLSGMIDSDPETARRNAISRNKETTSQLEDAIHLAAQDLKYSSSTIQADLDRFQRQKVADIREMCINMARSHREWAKKSLEAWEEAKREIDKIEEHPNRLPESVLPDPVPPKPRRDSTATINGR